MIRVKDDRDQVTIAKVYEAGQEHVFRFWDELSGDERRSLLDQLQAIDFKLLSALTVEAEGGTAAAPPLLEPAEPVRLPATDAERARWGAARAAGEELLRAGRVAVVMVAGGQGTRLGYPGPKGAYPVGPVSGKSLFQLHAERLVAASRRYGRPLPLYVMVSEATREPTDAFWRENRHFGLPPGDVTLFEQRSFPSADFRGKVLLEAKGRVATSPNGHGGVIPALEESGGLADLRRRGCDVVYYFQVDNALAKVADPVFLGFHALEGAEMSTKVVEKRDPEERVGVLGRIDGVPGVIEYSELPDAKKRERGPDGRLLFSAGSIAIHAFALSFLERVARGGAPLSFHKAVKKVPCIDRRGEKVQPTEPNGLKFEMFVFDALALARKTFALECAREEEFAPVKNDRGADSPETAKALISGLHARWLRSAGVEVALDAAGGPLHPVEVSPLFALDEDELRARAPRDLPAFLPTGRAAWSGPVLIG